MLCAAELEQNQVGDRHTMAGEEDELTSTQSSHANTLRL